MIYNIQDDEYQSQIPNTWADIGTKIGEHLQKASIWLKSLFIAQNVGVEWVYIHTLKGLKMKIKILGKMENE